MTGRDFVSSGQNVFFSKTNAENVMSRTHEAFLPRPDAGPSLQEILHDEHIGDDALIVPKRQATDRGEKCTGERVLVS